MVRVRSVLAVACLGAALATGGWFSGVLVLWFLGVNDAGAGWATYLRYLQLAEQPGVAPFAARIRAAGVLGFGLPLLLATLPVSGLV